jgi:ATP-dependent helicase HrpA
LHLPYRKDLPIFSYRETAVAAIKKHQVIVVTGETGCGKTTQLPLLCLDALGPEARIAITQPRRIAAVSIAKKVSDDLAHPLGDMVGYRTRFDECFSRDTRILFQTDGILVSEIGRDRFFNCYDAIIIDEAHERNLNIDVIIGHLRWLVKKRPYLKIIVSSATINPDLFSKAFDNAPIIRVEGRSYPIEIIYDSFDEHEMDVTAAATKAVSRITEIGEQGDILMFMPTERHIVSTMRKISAIPFQTPTIVLPLFARLSRAHQQRIFRPSAQRKIVIATNIAETSITVPGVRFVIDSGLARIKRYMPNSRVTALPVEPISRSSADQRAGRCGRTQEGVCIRLYSREDYLAMEDFTSAEISRSNIAGVILTMLSQRLGAISRFAFLEPPPPKAVKDAEAHLWELGALDKEGQITRIGREMAVFPVDPHLSRMIVASKTYCALPEVLVIVSALSCMDPRERPAEKTEAADQAHKHFGDPISDFVWYVNVWRAYHGEWNKTHSQSRMRAFCQSHFLSYTRIKEWRDVHGQLSAMAGLKNVPETGTFETIHKSLLTGLVAHIAIFNNETKSFKMSHGSSGTVFPGSMLVKKTPPWIMFAEKVETSRLFLRTLSHIDAEWIGEVAPHLVRRRYSGPYFDEEAGTVRATEQKIVFGLIIDQKNVAYGRINPTEANEIFIREGLIENKLRTHHGFLVHNLVAIENISILEKKLRVRDLYAGENELWSWYHQRIPSVTSIHDLNKIIHLHGNDALLRLSADDLLTRPLPPESALWPDYLTFGTEPFPCTYRYDPMDPCDGMTLHLPEGAQKFISDDQLSWLIKPMWEARILAMLESFPRETRKQVSPLAQTAESCSQTLRPDHRHFCVALSEMIKKTCGIELPVASLVCSNLPTHLCVHVMFDDNRPEAKRAMQRWGQAATVYERKSLSFWDFGDIPEAVMIAPDTIGTPIIRFPALCNNGSTIDLITLSSRLEANRLHADGVAELLKQVLEHEFALLKKNSSIDREDRLAIASLGDHAAVAQKAMLAVIEHYGVLPDPLCRSQEQFNEHLMRAKEQLTPTLRRLIGDLAVSGALCASIAGNLLAIKKSRPPQHKIPVLKNLIQELNEYRALVVSDEADFEFLSRFGRYLRRLEITVQRAMNDPVRYAQRMSEVRALEDRLNANRQVPVSMRRQLRKLLEEYKISLFAQQEVKALPGTSEKKVRDAFDAVC